MKNLNEYISESLLDDEDDLIENDDYILIEQFLKENYQIDGNINIHNKIVNIDGYAYLNTDSKQLTNGDFQFGEVNVFKCRNNDNLKSLEGSPRVVIDYFSCGRCKNLTTLKGAPEKCGDFACPYTGIKDLTGCPKEINGDFLCHHCENLTTLKGAPKKIHGVVSMKNNPKLKDYIMVDARGNVRVM